MTAFQEIEVKLYIGDLPALEERLRVCGAELIRARILECNYRLDTPKRDLKAAGRVLRLRKDDRIRVTYKDGRHVENGVITRREIEFTVDDLDTVRHFFSALGYETMTVYEKYRTTYALGDVEVVLDELPYGNFVEIEGPSSILIEGVTQMLGLDLGKSVDTTYLGLFERAKQSAGLDCEDLTFEAFSGVDGSALDLGVEPADT
jgi:adenylate cyclase class 2